MTGHPRVIMERDGSGRSSARVAGVLPFRGLGDPKTRLSSVLSIDERRELALGLLRRSIEALVAGGVGPLAVITMDPRVAGMGLDPRAEIIVQSGVGLNNAVRLGQHWAIEQGSDAVMIVLPDLPLVTKTDVQMLLHQVVPQSAIIAPDRHGLGTNALVLSPPDLIAPAFGEASADRHRQGLALGEIPVLDVQRPGTHLDLDSPDDLMHLLRLGYDWHELIGVASAR